MLYKSLTINPFGVTLVPTLDYSLSLRYRFAIATATLTPVAHGPPVRWTGSPACCTWRGNPQDRAGEPLTINY
ncbi:MAG: hypothetical protein ACHBN1_05440 [Heteroscytonema crispum UTEX LB 1556]